MPGNPAAAGKPASRADFGKAAELPGTASGRHRIRHRIQNDLPLRATIHRIMMCARVVWKAAVPYLAGATGLGLMACSDEVQRVSAEVRTDTEAATSVLSCFALLEDNWKSQASSLSLHEYIHAEVPGRLELHRRLRKCMEESLRRGDITFGEPEAERFTFPAYSAARCMSRTVEFLAAASEMRNDGRIDASLLLAICRAWKPHGVFSRTEWLYSLQVALRCQRDAAKAGLPIDSLITKLPDPGKGTWLWEAVTECGADDLQEELHGVQAASPMEMEALLISARGGQDGELAHGLLTLHRMGMDASRCLRLGLVAYGIQSGTIRLDDAGPVVCSMDELRSYAEPLTGALPRIQVAPAHFVVEHGGFGVAERRQVSMKALRWWLPR